VFFNANLLNNRNGFVMGGLIAGGLIGASVILSQVLKPTQPIAQTTVTPTGTSSNLTSPIPETPAISPSPIQQPTLTPQAMLTATPSGNATPTLLPSPNPYITPTNNPKAKATPTLSPYSNPYITPTNNPTANDYSWLSQRPVTDADLADKDGFELDIMRNWMFAIHGRRFDTPGIQDYFNNQPWYQPTYSPKEFPNKLLTPLEMRNANYITKYQDRYQLRHFKK
jgi:serine/threonine protein kinase, bacterial